MELKFEKVFAPLLLLHVNRRALGRVGRSPGGAHPVVLPAASVASSPPLPAVPRPRPPRAPAPPAPPAGTPAARSRRRRRRAAAAARWRSRASRPSGGRARRSWPTRCRSGMGPALACSRFLDPALTRIHLDPEPKCQPHPHPYPQGRAGVDPHAGRRAGGDRGGGAPGGRALWCLFGRAGQAARRWCQLVCVQPTSCLPLSPGSTLRLRAPAPPGAAAADGRRDAVGADNDGRPVARHRATGGRRAPRVVCVPRGSKPGLLARFKGLLHCTSTARAPTPRPNPPAPQVAAAAAAANASLDDDDDPPAPPAAGARGGPGAGAAGAPPEDVKGPHANLAVRISQRDPDRNFVLGERLPYVLLAGACVWGGGWQPFGDPRAALACVSGNDCRRAPAPPCTATHQLPAWARRAQAGRRRGGPPRGLPAGHGARHAAVLQQQAAGGGWGWGWVGWGCQVPPLVQQRAEQVSLLRRAQLPLLLRASPKLATPSKLLSVRHPPQPPTPNPAPPTPSSRPSWRSSSTC
jgi:hypothetical protein